MGTIPTAGRARGKSHICYQAVLSNCVCVFVVCMCVRACVRACVWCVLSENRQRNEYGFYTINLDTCA